MKKILVGLVLLLVISQISLAQNQRQRKSPEDKTSEVMALMQTVNMDPSTTEKVNTVFLDFFTKQQEAVRAYRQEGNNDRETIMAKRRELMNARDAQLKTILSEDQYKKYLSDVQPQISARPQRSN
jgi:hypothetical protein